MDLNTIIFLISFSTLTFQREDQTPKTFLQLPQAQALLR